MIIKYSYIVAALLFVLSVVIGKLFIFNKKDASFISDYCAGMAIVLGAYVFLSLAFVFIFPDVFSKGLMFFFAMSPFLIGLVATYNTEKLFTVLQLLIILGSVVYIV